METTDQHRQFRRVAVLITVCFVDMLGFSMVFPLLPFYALRFNAPPQIIGLILASFSVAQLLSAPLWGRVSDRYGRRPALMIGLSAAALAFTIFGFANSIGLLFLSRLVQGAGGGTTPVAQAYVADSIEPENRARTLGWLSAATNAGTMIGPVIGSFVVRFGHTVPGLLAAALCAVNVAFAWKWLPESKRAGHALRKPVWHTAWIVLRHPTAGVSRMIWIYAVGMLAFACLTSVLALYLNSEFGVTERTIGYVFLYVGVLAVIMRSLLLGPIVDRIGEPWAVRIGALCLVIGLGAYPLARSIWTLAAIMPLVPIGTALLFPSTTSLMSKASEKSEVGTTMGTAQTFAGISRIVAPVLAAGAFQRLSHSAPFFMASAIVAVVSLLAFAPSLNRQRTGGDTDRGALHAVPADIDD